jgi:hypothetical protein
VSDANDNDKAKVATVMGSMQPSSSGTVESGVLQMKQCWTKYFLTNLRKSPWKKMCKVLELNFSMLQMK